MDRKALSSGFMELLRLETLPVAVRLLKSRGDLPKKPLPFKLNICQMISMARHQGRTVAGVPGEMVCAIGAACTGLIETPAAFRDGTAAVGRYVANADAGRVFFENTFKLGDRGSLFEALLVAPLAESEGWEPQVVLFYCNPAQAMRLVHSVVYETGEKVAADTVAEAAVCSSIGFVTESGRPVIGLPCAGDRRFGGTQNHELVFSAPFGMLERMILSLQELAETTQILPIAPNTMWTPQMPAAYTIRPEDLPGGVP